MLNNLKDKVYGQHLVLKTVVRHLRAHMTTENPSKALVLSFHGGTGTGKTYVSSIIANSMYKEGLNSHFVHFIQVTEKFPHKKQAARYKVLPTF